VERVEGGEPESPRFFFGLTHKAGLRGRPNFDPAEEGFQKGDLLRSTMKLCLRKNLKTEKWA
jgi:hypothetical protein